VLADLAAGVAVVGKGQVAGAGKGSILAPIQNDAPAKQLRFPARLVFQ